MRLPSNGPLPAFFALVVLGAFIGTHPARATLISAPEVGDLRASAIALDDYFGPPVYPAITFGPAPTVTVIGAIGATTDVDWYSFTGPAGSLVLIDVDNTLISRPTQPVLSLFDSSGTLLAFSDDFGGDPGSSSRRDSFIGSYILPADDRYFVAVSPSAVWPDARSTGIHVAFARPDGVVSGIGTLGSYELIGATAALETFSGTGRAGNYAFHLSQAPEPGSPAMFAANFAVVGCLLRQRMRGRRARSRALRLPESDAG